MTEEELKVKRKEFLEDTVKYYSEETSRRATEVTSNGSPICNYRTEDGRKCAIGRHIPDEKYEKDIEGKKVLHCAIFNILPKNIKDLGQEFLQRVQSLHDGNDKWDKEGLSGYGLDYYKEIEREWII